MYHQQLQQSAYVSPPTAEAFLQLYREQGRQFVIKASGKELAPERLAVLVPQINFLTANGIYTILIYGGGDQIDWEWEEKHPGIPRPKVEGIGITTDQVIKDAVLPAYGKIHIQLQQALPDFQFFEPAQIPCDKVPPIQTGAGDSVDPQWVGRPNGFVIPQRKNVAIGFVGMVGKHPVNMNADSVAQATSQFDQAGELFFLTNTHGVLDEDGQVIPILLASELREDGSHPEVRIEGGMKQKTREARRILLETRNRIRKVAIIGGGDLRSEIEDWKGSGTLIFDPKDLHCSPATASELAIVDSLSLEYEADGRFRPRSTQEKELLRQEQRVVRIDTSPLGGFSLIDHGDCVELAGFWAGYPKNGIGRQIMTHAKRQFEGMGRKTLVALSTPLNPADPEQHKRVVELYEGYGFRCGGKVSELQGREDVPAHVSTYFASSQGRNPYLFIYKNPAPGSGSKGSVD